jgi:hypothetical protein
MGGFGSGRRTSRVCTDQLLKLDVRHLAKQGVLKKGMRAQLEWLLSAGTACMETCSHGDLVFLRMIQWADENVDQSAYQVPIESTSCHLGGERVWFRCPNRYCGRRVAILYGGKTFVCRHCWKANYRCQRETSNDRLFRKIYKLRAKMGWTGGCGFGAGRKPKNMSNNKYVRLCAVHVDLENEIDCRAEAMLRKISGFAPNQHSSRQP